MTSEPRPFRRFSFDWLSAREEGWTYALAAGADPATCETLYALYGGESDDDPPSVAHIESVHFTPAERAALPRVLVATGCATDDDVFTIQLEFVFDPETGLYAYESTDDNGSSVDADVGFSSDEGVTEWAEAHAGLCAAAETYAADLSDLSAFEDEDSDAPVDVADRLVTTEGADPFERPSP